MTELQPQLKRLYDRIGMGRKLGLERVSAACEDAGHPERAWEAVHVGGTNGKGSVCAFIAAIASAMGKRVGLYTSPHLVRFAERIQVDGQPVADDVLAEELGAVLDAGPELTFFEATTVAAFRVFARERVDLAVLEVGLGGRLDATNVIPPPRVAAITRVAFDHMDDLGDSLTAIAREKAAIIKEGSAVAVGKLHPDAREVVERRCGDVGARLLDLRSPEPTPGAMIAYPRMAMFGSNLAVAVTVAEELGATPEQMSRGIEAAVWPGRNELLHRNGQELTLLDCAHNPDATVALSHVLDPSVLGAVESRKDVVLVFGAVRGKNWRSMLDRLDQVAANRIFVAPPVSKAVDPREIAADVNGEVAESVEQALTRARDLVGPHGLVVVTGSSYLVGAARAALLGLEADPSVEM